MTMEKRWEPDKDEKLAILYEARADDPAPFECIKQYLRYPAKFRHGERTLIAELPKETSEGRDVKVFETHCAASFFTVIVLPDADRPGVIYESGSGSKVARLA